MTIGLDTTLLIEVELNETPEHKQARQWLHTTVAQRTRLAIAPQVLSEFIHVVTDPSRFGRPLSSQQAIERAEYWWNAAEVVQVVPTTEAIALFLKWMTRFKLGRKRVLDTMLAATYYSHGIHRIVTTNLRDYRIFSEITGIGPGKS